MISAILSGQFFLLSTPTDVDNFINDHKDGWIGDAGSLARKLFLQNKAKFEILTIGIHYGQN